MNQKLLQIISILFLVFFMVGCTPITAPALSPTPTNVPTNTPTTIPTETASLVPEIKQFKVCTPENFRDCPISVDELFDGTYLNWLNTLRQPFDPSKIRTDLQLYKYDNNYIIYWVGNLPHFSDANKGKEPFRRDITAAFVQYEGIDYAVLPLEIYNPEGESQIIITVYPFITGGGPIFDKAKQLSVINDRRKNQTTNVMRADNKRMYTDLPDPLVAKSFALYPDINDLTNNFVDVDHNGIKSGDRTVLSKPGLILLTGIYPQPIKD